MITGHAVVDTTLRMSSPRYGHGGNVTVSGTAGSVCCVAWKDDHQFATASADHVIQLHSGEQACTATLRGDAPDLTHLTWSPNGEHQPGCSMPTWLCTYSRLLLHCLGHPGYLGICCSAVRSVLQQWL